MSNVYDPVMRDEFLKHRMFTDPKSAEIISELVRHCDYLRNRFIALAAELEGLDLNLIPIPGDDGFVAGYKMKTGIWHRILGMIRNGEIPAVFPKEHYDNRKGLTEVEVQE